MNPSSALLWFPAIENLDIPIPKTAFVLVDRERILRILNGEAEVDWHLVERVKSHIQKYPVFLRTDLLSGKHEWKKTCYVPNEDHLLDHILAVCAANENKSCGPKVTFFPGVMDYSALVIREFLELETTFTAFSGDMPINKERRYFIKDGQSLCHHPYWPKDIFTKNSTRTAHDPNWQKKLEQLNAETDDEIVLLSRYARKVSQVLPEFWSIDFAKGKNGTWYLIDMARGEKSFHMAHA